MRKGQIVELAESIFFDQPEWLMLLPIILLLLAAGLWRNPWKLQNWRDQINIFSQQRYYYPASVWLRKQQQSSRKHHHRHHFILQYLRYGIFLCLLSIAMAQPFRQGSQLPEPDSYRDIIFLVDSSITMSLKDYEYHHQRIDRLSMLKTMLGHFFDSLKGSRIGITVFSNHAYTLSPLTTDHTLLKQQLKRVETAVLTGRTSNPANALLYTARQYLQYAEKPVLVMLTDLDRPDRQIDPRVAAAYIAKQGFRLHVIGIGAGTSQAEDDDPTSLIYQPANFRLLEEIATSGQGEFFWASSIANLNLALSRIRSSETHQMQTEPVYIKQPLYPFLLITALLWVTGWQLILTRKATS